ncbi:siphovirus Gp157 family protein [Listeria monocytogenes]|uniref:siphovirus Gp157 family protein n=1 Tax=Listeria monocytogenes TaxID=1639 RepID=UPI00054480CF|nr:siphovirus Gp157 family protein [Listeria monocytogenes]EAG6279384.1 siphovirus Gp157 family protein [Listeria monocytogenes CFSAN003809]EAC2938994.1 siphovirus Gp157 family protein [Listeria monocytogenes]EAC2957348.1 siphovirus Gp157 family protein [Listeria monocytogenes]EAC5915809.1 siphovirus Gp157 family protein [Listeria monocytogenes]EAC5918706.1 siphovirus Gp157 family protein [Listeria monocytogenes]
MPTLYSIQDKYQQLLNLAEQLDPELLKDTLESIDDELETKAENVAFVIKELEGQSLILEKETKRLAERKNTINNNVKRLKQSLFDAMITANKQKIKTNLFTLDIRKNPPSIIVEDESKLLNYLIEQPKKIDKTKLGDDLKKGIEVPGAKIIQTERLQIR